MLRRYMLKMLFSLLFLFLFTIRYVDLSFSLALATHPLVMGWEGTGIPVQEIEIEGWKKLNQHYNKSTELKKIAAELERKLKLKATAAPMIEDELDFSYVNLDGYLADKNRMIITLQSIKGEANTAETFCGLMVSLDSALDLEETLSRLDRACQPVVGAMPFTITLGGKIPGRLNEGEVYQLMRSVFRRLQVIESSGLLEQEYGRWAACSSLFDGSVVNVNGKRVNVEFGYRYIAEEDLTYLALATPVLSGLYW
ncbi:MAG: hypothetical protein GX050_08235 [Firmicutes bacterium]|nr:hypothetical protein [Bacillota bacterium]